MTKGTAHQWEFRARFRRNAFGWKSQPAIQRVREAVREIGKVARRDPVLAAEGAVMLIERLSPALERVDSSSGAIGTAVNKAIATLVQIIASAKVDADRREQWLERLWNAHEADVIPYIERLTDYWGELCGSPAVASAWADRLVDTTRMALSPDRNLRRHFHGTTACLSALYRAERYEEIIDILQTDTIWTYRKWAVHALVALGRSDAAIQFAEDCRGHWTPDSAVDAICEDILLRAGMADEAYTRYAMGATAGTTNTARFRATVAKYPNRNPRDILLDLAQATPGAEGKWFAAAKDAGFHAEALALASRSPCDPRTLTRAARDFADTEPGFAAEAGLLALRWLVAGHGYEITALDVHSAYSATMAAAERCGTTREVGDRARALIMDGGGFVATVLGDLVG